jgi:uncharacterized protein (TIGR02246 family)
MTDDRRLKQQIDELNAAAMSAFRRKDAAAIAAGFTTDGRFLAPGAPIAVGRTAIAAAWSQMLALPDIAASWQATTVEGARSGELAYEVGTYALSFDSGSGRVEDRGKYIVVWRKEQDGWKIAADMINSDLPAQ